MNRNSAWAERLESGLGYFASTFGSTDDIAQSISAFASLASSMLDDPLTGKDGSHRLPYEYSVELSPLDTQVRVFLRPWGLEGDRSPRSAWRNGWQLLEELERLGWADLSRLEQVRDIFRPVSDDAALGLCIGLAFTDDGAVVKAYLDCNAQGRESNRRLIREGLIDIGAPSTWLWLEQNNSSIAASQMRCLSLDLIASDLARTKVYVEGGIISAQDVIDRALTLDHRSSYAVRSLLEAAGMQTKAEWAPVARPVLCWAFTSATPAPSDLSIYMPSSRHLTTLNSVNPALTHLVPQEQADVLQHFLADHQYANGRDGLTPNPFHWIARKYKKSEAITLYVSATIVESCAAVHLAG